MFFHLENETFTRSSISLIKCFNHSSALCKYSRLVLDENQYLPDQRPVSEFITTMFCGYTSTEDCHQWNYVSRWN